jgi:hypothetical protein
VVQSREMYSAIYRALAEDKRRTGLFTGSWKAVVPGSPPRNPVCRVTQRRGTVGHGEIRGGSDVEAVK